MLDVRFTTGFLLLTAVLALTFLVYETAAQGDVIIGCPTYGCTPSGTFSSVLGNFPQGNVTVRWTSQVSQAPLPGSPLGCVGNDVNIVCPAIRLKGTGYVSVNPINGSIQWTDELLRFPPLPIMNIGGDIIACDGNSLVYYFNSGKMNGNAIPMEPSERPVYSLTMANNNLFFIISRQSGRLITYTTDGIPMGSIYINDKINSQTGAFVPIAQPVIAGHRVYILMEFKVNNGGTQPSAPEVRIFAVDLCRTINDRLRIAWNLTVSAKTKQKNTPTVLTQYGAQIMAFQKTIYVILPTKEESRAINYFLAVRDSGDSASLQFVNKNFDVIRMVANGNNLNGAATHGDDLRETNNDDLSETDAQTFFREDISVVMNSRVPLRDSHVGNRPALHETASVDTRSPNPNAIWLITRSGILASIDPASGAMQWTVPLNYLLRVERFNITSQLMLYTDDNGKDPTLLFAGLARKGPAPFLLQNCVFAIDVSSVGLKWSVPVPGNGTVQGQIIGIPSDSDPSVQPDQVVALSTTTNGQVLFAIGSASRQQ